MNKRYCLALDLKDSPQLIEDYKRQHQNVWPEITKSIRDAGIETAFRLKKRRGPTGAIRKFKSGKISCGSFSSPCRRLVQERSGFLWSESLSCESTVCWFAFAARANFVQALEKMAGTTGLEPATSAVTDCYFGN